MRKKGTMRSKLCLVVLLFTAACSYEEELGQSTFLSSEQFQCEEECTTHQGGKGRLLCHEPPGDGDNSKTLCIGKPGVLNGHLEEHEADYCGECRPVCGDDVCHSELETCSSCSEDCGRCPPVCGDQLCDEGEDCEDCPADCGGCGPVCGDTFCEGEENCGNCEGDCGECQTCGDETCNTDETCQSCPSDCGECGPQCGDGVCEGEENCGTCRSDCGDCLACGDQLCLGEETCESCPNDCGFCSPPADEPDAGVNTPDAGPTEPEQRLGVQGGGCSTSGGTTTPGLLLAAGLMMLLSLYTRKRYPKVTCMLLAAVIVMGVANIASAQDFDTERFTPGQDDGAILGVEDGGTAPKGSHDAYFWVNVSDDPLVLQDLDADERVRSLVDARITWGIGFTYSLHNRLQVGLQVPVTVQQQLDSPTDTDGYELDGTLGDITVAPKMMLVDGNFQLALLPTFTVPTALQGRYLGGEAPTFTPTLAASFSVGMWRANLNAGVRFQKEKQLLDLNVDDELIAKAGIAYGWGVGTELEAVIQSATELSDPYDSNNREYLEAMVGYRRYFGPGLSAFFGGGRNLTDGFGGPDWRAIVGLRYSEEADYAMPECGPLGGTGCPRVAPPKPRVAPPKPRVVKEDPPAVETPSEPETPAVERRIVVPGTWFDFDKDEVKDAYVDRVWAFGAQVGRLMESDFNLRISILVEGHTDAIGPAIYNVDLGMRRARAVAAYLEWFVPLELITVESRGETQPVDTNKTDEGRANNRRVVIILTNTGDVKVETRTRADELEVPAGFETK